MHGNLQLLCIQPKPSEINLHVLDNVAFGLCKATSQEKVLGIPYLGAPELDLQKYMCTQHTILCIMHVYIKYRPAPADGSGSTRSVVSALTSGEGIVREWPARKGR